MGEWLRKLKESLIDGSRGNTKLFLLSVLLAFFVWFIHNLSQNSTNLVTVNVWAVSNIDGRASRSSEPSAVVARCSATGFRLIRLSLSDIETEVVFDRKDLVHGEGDFFSVDASALERYAADIFGGHVRLESYVAQSVQFRFPEETFRKVPVEAVKLVSYRPQYMALSPMKLTPDSVLVYGDPRLLASIDKVCTRQINLSDLRRSVHGVVRLDAPGSVRLSESEVSYSVDVARYVELRSDVHIGTRHVPVGHNLAVLPSTAEAVFRFVFPTAERPEDLAEFYIDYADFAGSLSGKCVARCDGLPEGVIEWHLVPEVFECVETQ